MHNSTININEACGTHTGLVREANEDAFFADAALGLWIVADGMGGHHAGEVASAIASAEIPRCVQQRIDQTFALLDAAGDFRTGNGTGDLSRIMPAHAICHDP